MENIYLSKSVAQPLIQCLSEVASIKPNDPIEWIAHWLYRFIDNELYFYEKSLFLKDLQRTQRQLERQRAMRLRNSYDLRGHLKSMAEMLESARSMGNRYSQAYQTGQASEAGYGSQDYYTLDEDVAIDSSVWRPSSEMSKLLASGRSMGNRYSQAYQTETPERNWEQAMGDFMNEPSSEPALRMLGKHMRSSQEKTRVLSQMFASRLPFDDKSSQEIGDQMVGMIKKDTFTKELKDNLKKLMKTPSVEWSLDCRMGLICDHALLGTMRSRPPLIPPETPEWWERREYLENTLYDHEIYSVPEGESYELKPEHAGLVSLSYKDFVEQGKWLQQGLLRGMQESLQELYRK